MQFEITTDFLNSLRDAIHNNDKTKADELIVNLFPADIAEIMGELEPKEAKFIYSLLNEEDD